MTPTAKMKHSGQTAEPTDLWLTKARELAAKAAAEIRRLADQPLAEHRKTDRSLVTIADLRSDQILREGLRKAFPDHAVLSEESGIDGPSDSQYVWLIDPLDGTKAYAKGIPGFAVMVGLLKAGQPFLGVIIDPHEGHCYHAIRGQGAFHTFDGKQNPLTVSARSSFEQMPLVVSTDFPDHVLAKIRKTLSGPCVNPINSVGIKAGLLVRKIADIYINHHSVHLWDTCAPQLILEEAGGVFTRLDGTPLHYRLKPPYSHGSLTLASNGTRHEDVVQLIREKNIFTNSKS